MIGVPDGRGPGRGAVVGVKHLRTEEEMIELDEVTLQALRAAGYIAEDAN